MAELNKYISSLEEFTKNIPSIVDEIVDFRSPEFVKIVQHRLFNYGIDGNNDELASYKEVTIFGKVLKNHPFDRTTLLDTGSFYQGMFVNSKKGNIELFSTDKKTPLLIDQYGKAILEFTNEEQQKIVDEVIDPELNNQIKNLSKTIEFSIT